MRPFRLFKNSRHLPGTVASSSRNINQTMAQRSLLQLTRTNWNVKGKQHNSLQLEVIIKMAELSEALELLWQWPELCFFTKQSTGQMLQILHCGLVPLDMQLRSTIYYPTVLTYLLQMCGPNPEFPSDNSINTMCLDVPSMFSKRDLLMERSLADGSLAPNDASIWAFLQITPRTHL